ncbi:hypothetical protein GO986_17980 [Deinococcus sp. HMF7620]|uniref:Uncharacterized protein n=1 Tax=Deinococcus arboris TaxID=2682977 RepID=A0A7C9I150_9DEIO|nr:hypothetical protein [Deinococcus arboris]MVN88628.1 hypothetical protein [Deinococcus arboris]
MIAESTLVYNGKSINFDPSSLTPKEIRDLTIGSFAPPIVGLIGFPGLEMYQSLELNLGSPKVNFNGKSYIVSLLKDEYNSSPKEYFAASLRSI